MQPLNHAQSNNYVRNRFDAVIVANGEYPWHAAPLRVLQNAPCVVCCDGAADEYINRGFQPDAIIGDGDSIHPATLARAKHLFHHRPDQNSNDQSKALEYLRQQGKQAIAIVGACGKREDHTLANIGLLMHYLTQGLRVMMFSNYGVFVPARDDTQFSSHAGQQISVFNFTAKNLHSDGLLYALYDFQHWYQGTLNEACAECFTIRASGDYLVFLNY